MVRLCVRPWQLSGELYSVVVHRNCGTAHKLIPNLKVARSPTGTGRRHICRKGKMKRKSYGAFSHNLWCEDSPEATSDSERVQTKRLEKIFINSIPLLPCNSFQPLNIHPHAPSVGPSPPGIIYPISITQIESQYHTHIIPIQQNLSQLFGMFSSMSTKVSRALP